MLIFVDRPTCTCTCVVMSGEADVLNTHIISPVLVELILEGVGRRSIHNVLWKSIPVYHYSLAYFTIPWIADV